MKLRNFDAHGQPVCSVCGEATNAAYGRFPFLNCWNCCAIFEPLAEGEGQAIVATLRHCVRELEHSGVEAFLRHVEKSLDRLESLLGRADPLGDGPDEPVVVRSDSSR